MLANSTWNTPLTIKAASIRSSELWKQVKKYMLEPWKLVKNTNAIYTIKH